MNKEVIYIDNGILVSNEKQWIFPFVTTWMELEDINTQWNKSEKYKYYMISLAYKI